MQFQRFAQSRLMLTVTTGLFVLSISTITAITGANTVPTTRAEDDSRSIAVNDKKPDDCASIAVTGYISGNGTVNGGAASELITGGSASDTIRGGGSNDCILGGGGSDTLRGDGGGNDICIGGPGTDSFHSSCEVQIQ